MGPLDGGCARPGEVARTEKPGNVGVPVQVRGGGDNQRNQHPQRESPRAYQVLEVRPVSVPAIDMAGRTIGRLVVIEQAPNPARNPGRWWWTLCTECREQYAIPGRRLRRIADGAERPWRCVGAGCGE